MQKRLALSIASIFLAPLSFAEPTPPADPAPAKADIPALIKQLGDDSPKVRDQASEKLRHLGADAIPALTEAEKSDDAEVVSRSQSIQRQIDEDLHPKPKVDPNARRSTIILGNGQPWSLAAWRVARVMCRFASRPRLLTAMADPPPSPKPTTTE